MSRWPGFGFTLFPLVNPLTVVFAASLIVIVVGVVVGVAVDDVAVVVVVHVAPGENVVPLFAIEVKSSLPSTVEFSPETDLHS